MDVSFIVNSSATSGPYVDKGTLGSESLRDVYFDIGSASPSATTAKVCRNSGQATGTKFKQFACLVTQIRYWCLHGEPSIPQSQVHVHHVTVNKNKGAN